MRPYRLALSVCIISLISFAPVYADEDCDLTLREAKTAYNAGEYSKAKKLYDYVVNICGASYGNASSWSQKCQEALTPKLSVSRSNISVGAYSGTTSITVTSNRTWKLNNTSSSLFTVNRSGDNITISYSANPNTSSRSDYFDVVTTDGSKSVRVYVNQDAKANTTPYISVNKTSISASASGTTEYITVSSNTTWDVQYASGTMYSVTRNGNTLTVTINANTSTESRSDFFNVKTTDGSKVQKISLSQYGKSSSSSSSSSSSTPTQYQVNQMSAEFTSVSIDHNVYNGGETCMKIHSHFSVRNMKGFKGYVIVWVYDRDGNNQTSYKTDAKYEKYINNSHSILSWETITPRYDSSEWEDFVLYLPNALLSKGGYIQVEIREFSTGKSLAWSNKVNFTYGNQ